jgi:hypothetical protein
MGKKVGKQWWYMGERGAGRMEEREGALNDGQQALGGVLLVGSFAASDATEHTRGTS